MTGTDEYRLTTVDNPYNPFTEFESWFLYDTEKGYNTCGYLARILGDSLENSDDEISKAIDEIIKNDFLNVYRKVKK